MRPENAGGERQVNAVGGRAHRTSDTREATDRDGEGNPAFVATIAADRRVLRTHPEQASADGGGIPG